MSHSDEKLLREFLRRTIVEQKLEEQRQEHQVRIWIRSVIAEVQDESVLKTLFEAKDQANPHPNTGINKLRDALRKAKPSIKSKYQQLTTDPAQRESFKNHFLTAMVRLFDEMDALNAQGNEDPQELGAELQDVETGEELEAPPAEVSSDQMADDIESSLDGLLESILKELEIDVEDEDEKIDLVGDEEEKAEKSQVEKDFEKKSSLENEREEFGMGLEGDATGRNQAFDAFNLVQTYFSDSYFDLNNPEDQEMFKKWCLYNIKLLFDKYEGELEANPAAPHIENPS
jgi:hypothetical protein